jgi:hypothetical protein
VSNGGEKAYVNGRSRPGLIQSKVARKSKVTRKFKMIQIGIGAGAGVPVGHGLMF